MALAAVKTWNAGDVLFAADLNAMNTNILNNALTLISPLTGNLNINLKQLQSLVLENLASDPAAATVGRIWYNTASQSIGYDPGSSAPTVTFPLGYQANCRLVPVTSSNAALQPYQGNKIPLKTGSAWSLWTIPSSGLYLGSTQWSGTGSTFNYVYCQNVGGVLTLSLKTSAVAHSVSSESGVEVATTDSTLTLVGCAVGSSINGSFFSTYALNNGIASFYNRKPVSLQAFLPSAGTVTTTGLGAVSGTPFIYFPMWGDDLAQISMNGAIASTGLNSGVYGVSVDSNWLISPTLLSGGSNTNFTFSNSFTLTSSYAEGQHNAQMAGSNTVTGKTVTFPGGSNPLAGGDSSTFVATTMQVSVRV